MKKCLFMALIAIVFMLGIIEINAQETKIPSVSLKNLKGETIDTKTISNEGKPFIINFWATWCKSCILELTNLNDLYTDWKEETGVKIFAISIDDTRNSKKVAPFVKGRNWEYEVLLDENSDFKRAMNINNPPHTFLFNSKGELVWQHNGYAPGDEEILHKELQKLISQDKK